MLCAAILEAVAESPHAMHPDFVVQINWVRVEELAVGSSMPTNDQSTIFFQTRLLNCSGSTDFAISDKSPRQIASCISAFCKRALHPPYQDRNIRLRKRAALCQLDDGRCSAGVARVRASINVSSNAVLSVMQHCAENKNGCFSRGSMKSSIALSTGLP